MLATRDLRAASCLDWTRKRKVVVVEQLAELKTDIVFSLPGHGCMKCPTGAWALVQLQLRILCDHV